MEFVFLQSFILALALGALVGLEREYARYKKRGHDYAGIRTFPLISLFGALAAYFGKVISIWILIVAMILISILIIIAYFANVQKSRIYHGATSEVAGFITFFVGVLCFYNEFTFAAFITIVMTILLYARSRLHHFAEHIQKKELGDTLKFAVVAFIILPFLPDKSYGPYEIFNPYTTWLMVVFISAISFVGYIAMKWLGEKGVTLAGILGGLVSSTAVTTSFAQRSKKEPQIYQALVLGVILADGIMFIRILFVLFFLNTDLYTKVLLPFLALIILTALFSYFLWKKASKVKGKVHLTSPFTIVPALKFGLFFAFILAIVKIGHIFFANRGVYLVSLLSGFADVDAITISLSQLAKDQALLITARNGVIIAALTNVATKAGIAYVLGERKFGWTILSFFACLIIIGLLIIYFV